ncbi:MAG: hypothetical protein AABY22_19850 [Nanoarchaeota archaeon]
MICKTWQEENLKINQTLNLIKIPDEKLIDVSYVDIKYRSDLKKLPVKSGVYWIYTDEPIHHSFNDNPCSYKINDGDLTLTPIYNGSSISSIRGRISSHLFSNDIENKTDAGNMSGISVDVFPKISTSHRKNIWSKTGKKLPLFNNKKIVSKSDIDLSSFSTEEINIINSGDEIFFANGINVESDKHKDFCFRVYYIYNIHDVYCSHIENQWRINYGCPKLCTYVEGR